MKPWLVTSDTARLSVVSLPGNLPAAIGERQAADTTLMAERAHAQPGRFRSRATSAPRVERAEAAGPFCGASQAGAPQSLQGNIVFDNVGRVLHYSERLHLLAGARPAGIVRNLSDLLQRLLADMPDVHAALFRQLGVAAAQNSGREIPVLTAMPSGRCLFDAELARMADGNWILSLSVRTQGLASQPAAPGLTEQDQLTGGANRTFFERQVEAALRELAEGTRESVIVMYLELERFKSISESFGPALGDSLLRLASERLGTALRETDALARLTGGLFGILLEGDTDASGAGELTERLLGLVRRPYRLAGQVVHVNASVGMASAPTEGRTATELLRSADIALYHAKNAGQGSWNFFAPSMGERAQRRRLMEVDLQKALEGQQFEVHYQPQIEVQTQKVVGMEALLRWRHPQQGLMLPNEFLPLAEELGLDAAIAAWTLRTACTHAVAWPGQLGVAVNVGASHFASDGFLQAVQDALRSAGLAPERLELEVTEDILMAEEDQVRSKLQGLRDLGVRVAIDGFGTGSASISQLVSFPFSKIKVARSLVASEEADRKSRAVLRAVSGLGHDLSMQMMAVGVETLEQVAHARADGYSSVQGFYYSDAVPADKVGPMLATFATAGT